MLHRKIVLIKIKEKSYSKISKLVLLSQECILKNNYK